MNQIDMQKNTKNLLMLFLAIVVIRIGMLVKVQISIWQFGN